MKSSLHLGYEGAGCFWSWTAIQHTMENHDRLRRKNLTTEQKICKTPINTKAEIKLAGIATMAIILVIGIMKKNDENQQRSYTGKAEADIVNIHDSKQLIAKTKQYT